MKRHRAAFVLAVGAGDEPIREHGDSLGAVAVREFAQQPADVRL
jgi:hypothetical protein